MLKNAFLLYGANGYTGELIARYAAQFGLQPVLAGRNREAVFDVASELGMAFRVFDLNDREACEEALQDVVVVVHAAGPYDFTAKQMVEACIATGTH